MYFPQQNIKIKKETWFAK